MQSLFKQKMFSKPFISSVIMMSVFMLFVLILLPIKYHAVDDVGMVMRVSGISKTGAPSEFIMNSNILLGRFLAGLYKVWPNFDWYPAYLLLMVFLSGVAINFAALRLRYGFQALAICTVFLLVVMSFYIAELNYTTIASLLGIGSAALILSILFKPPETKNGLIVFGLSAVALFILCTLLRERSLLLMGGFTFIASVIVLGFNRKINRAIMCAIIGFSAFGIGSAFMAYDRHSYRVDSEMHAFKIQKKIKSRFIEYGQITYNENNRHVFETCNVSENDFMMMRFWFYDTRIENFSVEKIKCLADGFPKRKQNIDTGKVIENVVKVYQNNKLILILILGLGLLGPRSPPKTILVIFACTLPALVFIYLNVFYKPAPSRISVPVFGFFAGAILVAHMATLIRQEVKRKQVNFAINSVAVIMMLGASGLQINNRVEAGKLVEIRQNKVQAYTAEFSPDGEDIYLVWIGDAYPLAWAPPFGGVRKLFANYNQVGVGTSFNSPLSRAQLLRFNLNNPYVDIVDNEHAQFMFRERNVDKLFLVYKDFLRVNYALDVCFVVEKKIDFIITGHVITCK